MCWYPFHSTHVHVSVPFHCRLNSIPLLYRGVDLMGNTVGKAFVGTMCRGASSVGLSQDGGSGPVASVGSVAAHELGHIFSMQHDDDASECMRNSKLPPVAASNTKLI